MIKADEKQKVFERYQVPDPIRIKKVLKFIRKYFGSVTGISILECGIAKGGVVDLLSRQGAVCWGIDVNPRNMPDVNIIQADLNMGFPIFNRKFDVIFAGEVMEHIFDDVKLIRSCKELLKPGGLLIITVPNLCFVVNRLLILFGQIPMFSYELYHYHIYTKKTLCNLVEKEGFEILKLSSSHTLFSTRRNKIGIIFEILGDFFLLLVPI